MGGEVPGEFPTHRVQSINDTEAVGVLQRSRPDIILVYGTNVIRQPVFSMPRLGTVNAHGGWLPGYRGLDTNLWTAYEGRPQDMAVTLHFIDQDIDTGAVILQRRIQPVPGLCLQNLRYHTTLICCDLFAEVLRQAQAGKLDAVPQREEENRYFGPMPTLLKLVTDRVLRTYGERGISNVRNAT